MEVQRESIFVSALRSFCKMFFAVCGLFVAFLLVSSLYSLAEKSEDTTESKTNTRYLPDANGNRESSTTSPVILQVNVHGLIGNPKEITSESIEHILLDSRTGSFKGDRVKGILLHFNTPGGVVFDIDNIYQMLKTYKERYKVPIFGYVDGLCASGGVYISCTADKIFAGPSSIIGSVGVLVGPFFNVAETLGRVGVVARTITEGLDKDMMSPFRPWKPDEDSSLKAIAAYSYNHFVDIVTSSRPIDKTKLVEEYGAKVFDPETALKYGYIDQANATRDQALLALLDAAGVDATKTYQVVTLEPKNEWISSLFNANSVLFTGKVVHSLDTGAPPIQGQIAYLYQYE